MSVTHFDPRNCSPHKYFAQAISLGLNERNARRLLAELIGHGRHEPDLWIKKGIVPKRMSEYVSDLPRLTLQKTVISPSDGFTKLLFHTHEGYPIETVLIPLEKDNRISICLSSQVGCVMGCAFCATARMPQRRNLKTWEILDQFIYAKNLVDLKGKKTHSVVFMGMGEPFLNYESVLSAAELISYPVARAIAGKAITISTVGIVDNIYRFTDEKRPFRLSISLGAATDEKRARLVPIAAKAKVSEVMNAARYHAIKRKERVMISYVCISGENVSVEDAMALGDVIGDTPVRLDLIEVTDSTGRFKKPSPKEMSLFRDALRLYVGQPVVRRYSGGADINASCGTLAGE